MQRVPTAPDGSRGWLSGVSKPVLNTQDTPSESSEAENTDDDTNEEEGWDSGEQSLLPDTQR